MIKLNAHDGILSDEGLSLPVSSVKTDALEKGGNMSITNPTLAGKEQTT